MDAVEDIKGRLSIEDVIGEYVQLKRAGRNFRGLSPFKAERTASFMVSPEKQIWHDFSSGKGGNIFSFIMEVEGLDFKEALELLARKAGVDLSQYSSTNTSSNAKLKERCYKALDLATKFYQVQFSKNRAALDYILKQRQFSRDIVLEFRIGYSPNTGKALTSFLVKKGFLIKELQQAGLTTRSYRSPSDMFRGRIMVPLADAQGRIIGFTARTLSNDYNEPKYINTAQTILYDKSRNVFGLNLAKDAIRKNNFAVIVEGNLDVISSHMMGVRQVIATAGTAITAQHIKTINNFCNDIRLAFDNDQAGKKATERAIPIAGKLGVNLNIIDIGQEYKDPDELIRDKPKLWEQRINEPKYALDWLIDSYKIKFDITSAQGKRKFSDAVFPTVAQLTDTIEKDHYITMLASLLGVSKEAVREKVLDKVVKPTLLKKIKPTTEELTAEVLEQVKNQDQLLAITLINPELRIYLNSITSEMIVGEAPSSILNFLKENSDFREDPLMASQLNKHQDYVKMLMLQYEALYQDLDKNDLDYETQHLRDQLIVKYVKLQKNSLAHALQKANDQETQVLLEKAKQLDSLLKEGVTYEQR